MKKIFKILLNQLGFSFHLIKNTELGSISFKIVKVSKHQKFLDQLARENPFRNPDLKLLNSNNGYHYIYPQLTDAELKKYYEEHYWQNYRNTNFVGVKERDFFHFDLVEKYKLIEKGGKILNFGSGHGGISFIFSILKNEVINFEYDKTLKQYASYFKTIDDFKYIEDNSVDLIYASHSLEHVSDIDTTINNFKRVASPNCKVFFEVPNGEHIESGSQKNLVDEPHTYYFTYKYFEKILSKNILLKTYNGDFDLDEFENISNFSNEHNSLVIIGEL